MRRRILFFLFALLFIGVSVSIDFFHTETDGRFDSRCPACQFHAAAIGEHTPASFCLAVPLPLIPIPDVPFPACSGLPHPTSARPRAPPAT